MATRPSFERGSLRGALASPSLALAAVGLGVALASGGCPLASSPPFSDASRGGVTVSVLGASAVPVGPHVQARPGDFLIATDRVRVVVGARSQTTMPEFAGALIDVTAGAWHDDALGSLSPIAEIDGHSSQLLLRSVHPKLDGERPTLVLVHETERRELRLETEVRLVPGEPRVELSTRVENLTETPHRLRVGDRLRWEGATVFGPGIGFIEHADEVVLPWFARPGRKQSYAMVFPGTPATVRVRSSELGPEEQFAMSPELVLGSGASTKHERALIVVSGPLENVAEVAWRLSGKSIGYVEGRLAPEPAWATVEARDSEGRIVGSVEPRLGSFRIPLPPGSYHMLLRSPGGTDEHGVQVQSDQSTSLQFLVPGVAKLSYRINDDQDRPLPSRIVVRGIPPTLNPDFGPWHLAAGAANIAETGSGEGMVELPPGHYSVLATRGPEYTISVQDVEVSLKKGAALRARLDRVVDTSGFIAADLHLHADPSGDSEVSLHDRVISLLSEGVEFAAATDHNHISDYGPVIRDLNGGERLAATPGVEITTRDWGHFNAYPYSPNAAMPPHSTAAPDRLFEFVRREEPNAVIQVNHPRMAKIGYFNRADIEPPFLHARPGASFAFDALEVWNGFDLAKLGVLDEMLHEWMELIARGRRYTAVGNSDSHRIAYQWAGYPRTYLQVPDDHPEKVSYEAVTDAIKRGRAIVTSGPFIDVHVGGQGLGAMVTAKENRVSLEIEVRAPPWIGVDAADVLVNGNPVLHVDSHTEGASVSDKPNSRLHYSGSLPMARDGFVIVLVRGTTTLDQVLPGTKVAPVAFTNPIFVDANGDGRFTPSLTNPSP